MATFPASSFPRAGRKAPEPAALRSLPRVVVRWTPHCTLCGFFPNVGEVSMPTHRSSAASLSYLVLRSNGKQKNHSLCYSATRSGRMQRKSGPFPWLLQFSQLPPRWLKRLSEKGTGLLKSCGRRLSSGGSKESCLLFGQSPNASSDCRSPFPRFQSAP